MFKNMLLEPCLYKIYKHLVTDINVFSNIVFGNVVKPIVLATCFGAPTKEDDYDYGGGLFSVRAW